MAIAWKLGRVAGNAGIVGLALIIAGCQSGQGGLNPGGGQAVQPQVQEAELTAYCPSVVLREGTAAFATYERNATDDPSRLIHQASVTDVSRSCSYSEAGTLRMNVGVAGRVVPGPAGRAGSVRLPIRVAVQQAGQVVYSQLHTYEVQIADTAGATQFVFTDTNIAFPTPTGANVQVFAGFDEGPQR